MQAVYVSPERKSLVVSTYNKERCESFNRSQRECRDPHA